MRITDTKYLLKYKELIGESLSEKINHLDFSNYESSLGYSTQVSAVFSSNIEGNSIDLNSFMNYKLNKAKFKSKKEINEIEDLILAYEYAQQNALNEKTFLQTHKILSKSFLIKSKQGNYRIEKIGVFGIEGLVYLAIEPELVKPEMNQFFEDISELLSKKLSIIETLYFASLIHLKFAHIHPFADGNGRAARLIEKWFLTQKLGKSYWNIPSEQFYKENQAQYYNNINLGVNYYELNYDNSLNFLTMLPYSII